MAIYSEETDPNEKAPTSKDLIIEKIVDIIDDYGGFTIAEVEAESSPIIESKGKLTHLGEEFYKEHVTVRVYDPNSHSSDEIDEYEARYQDFEEDQLAHILTLAEKWVDENAEEE
jgi:hypothetical protein